MLAAATADAATVRLNGDAFAHREFGHGADDTTAPMREQPIAAGPVELARGTSTFLAGPDAENAACR